VAQAWTCSACGKRNTVDETECSACGRWASVFDLERVGDVGDTADAETVSVDTEWRPTEAEKETREPIVPAGPRPSAAEVFRSVLDALREGQTTSGPEAEPKAAKPRSARIFKWIAIAIVLLWFVLPPLLDAIS
jgi:hypothetical protein